MTLRIPYDDFAATATRHKIRDVYARPSGTGTELTAALGDSNRIVVCRADEDVDAVRSRLKPHGVEVHNGVWSQDGASELIEEPVVTDGYIAAVSFVSEDTVPGVWIDAYPSLPSEVQVLRSLYDEFRATGELGEVAFEEFVRLAQPNVVIAAPNEIQGYLAAKTEQ
jgi:hypothetical protein